MAKRTKPNDFKPIKDLREADNLLGVAAGIRRELSAIDGQMNAAIDNAKQVAEAESHSLQQRLTEIERRLQAFAEYNKADLFDKKKSVELMHGLFGFRQSTKLKQLKGFKIADTLEKLKEFGWLDGIRPGKESINKDVLGEWSDDKLASVGQQRDISDQFWYEIKEESVENAL